MSWSLVFIVEMNGGKRKMDEETDVYGRLQQHLDKMPIGYPSTETGVELRLLKQLFTPEQARIALALDYTFRTIEQTHERLPEMGLPIQELEAKLEDMANRGNIFAKKKDGVNVYATLPLMTMFDLQVNRLTPEFLEDLSEYLQGEFGKALSATKVPQLRVIPLRKSIKAEHRIGTYDELRDLIEKAEGRIRIGECICRKSMQTAGNTCSVTTRKETCMGFRDFGDLMGRMGWGRSIKKEEVAAKNEEEGLVLEPSNQQDVQFICSCCGDCCLSLKALKILPRPAEVVASNYYAQVKAELCDGCGICVDRCQMEAVMIQDTTAKVNRDRCIGCGLCVSKCPPEVIYLVKKGKELVPPKDLGAMFEAIKANRIQQQA